MKRFIPWAAGLLVVLSLALVSSFTMGQNFSNSEIAHFCQSYTSFFSDARTAALVQASCMACERDNEQACQVLRGLLATSDETQTH